MRYTLKGSTQITTTTESEKIYNENQDNIYNKLARLEDIEEELGIELIILFKALKNGVYYRNTQREINYADKVRLSFAYKTLVVDRHTCKYLTDYGKTWALTKGELK